MAGLHVQNLGLHDVGLVVQDDKVVPDGKPIHDHLRGMALIVVGGGKLYGELSRGNVFQERKETLS